MKEKKIPVIIDTDPGDDDAASILWVLSRPEYDVKALTISNGNVGVDKCAINALRILELCGRTDIPVYKGAWKPMVCPARDAAWIHGEDGLGDMGFPLPVTPVTPGYAPAEMARIVRESETPVTILALAPITNVALAILLEPAFKDNVEKVLFMGGAVLVPGNESPNASFNVAIDPHAAKIVYDSGIPVVQLGLDVCDKATILCEDLDRIAAANTPVSDFVIRMLEFRRKLAVKVVKNDKGEIAKELRAEEQAGRPAGSVGLNDLTATAYLINPDWFKTKHITVEIETGGLCPGRTAADFQGLWGKAPNCHFAYDFEGRKMVDEWVQAMIKFD